MLTLTLTQALDYTGEDIDSHYLYLYRDGDVIFYVGQSVNPQRRLYEHLGIRGARGSGDEVGQIMHDNHPASLTWTVELYTLADCEPLVREFSAQYDIPRGLERYQKQVARITEKFEYSLLKAAMSEAEIAMIHLFCPCMNVRRGAADYHNSIPECYLEEEKKRYKEIGDWVRHHMS